MSPIFFGIGELNAQKSSLKNFGFAFVSSFGEKNRFFSRFFSHRLFQQIVSDTKKISTTIVDPTNLLARVHLLPPFKQRNDKKSFLMCVCVCVRVCVCLCVRSNSGGVRVGVRVGVRIEECE